VSQRKPKVSQRDPKVSQVQHKINIKDRFMKQVRKMRFPALQMYRFCEGFPSRFVERIDAEIDTEKIMKLDETSTRKLIELFMFCEACVHEKASFSKKANVRKPYESSSKTRVGEDSAKKKKIRKRIIS